MANEFENLEDEEFSPALSNIPSSGNDVVAKGEAGIVYDWTSAPEGTKQAPRKDLHGQVVTVTKTEIIIPPMSRPWMKTRDGKKDVKFATLRVYYSIDNQSENYSGVRVFKREADGKELVSHPTILRDRLNQASQLLGLVADYLKKDIQELSLKSFMAFMNGHPKARIERIVVTNPTTGEKITKNMIKEFLAP